MPPAVDINPETSQFEVRVDGLTAVLKYKQRGTVLSLIHTEVPEALRGKGLAEALASTALDYARERGFTVKPYCPFVAAFIRRHQEYSDLIDPGFQMQA